MKNTKETTEVNSKKRKRKKIAASVEEVSAAIEEVPEEALPEPELKQPEGERLPKEEIYKEYKQLIKSDLFEWKFHMAELSSLKHQIDKYKTLLQVEIDKNPKIKEYQTIINSLNADQQKKGAEYNVFIHRIEVDYEIDKKNVAIDDVNGVLTGIDKKTKI